MDASIRSDTAPRLIAGLGLALHAPAIFFDGLVQKTVLDVASICLTLWHPVWPLVL